MAQTIENKNNKHEIIRPFKYRLAIIHKMLFHPFVYPDLEISLKVRKYSLTRRQTSTIMPAGDRTYIDGFIATKDDCIIQTDSEKKLIAIEGDNTEKIIQITEDLLLMSKEDFDISLNTDTDYAELTVNYVVDTGKNPMNIFDKFKTKRFDRFSELLEYDTTLFGIRLVPNLPPYSRYWHDIEIRPRLTRPNKEYYVSVIYRSEDIEKVINFTKRVDTVILTIIEEIENE